MRFKWPIMFIAIIAIMLTNLFYVNEVVANEMNTNRIAGDNRIETAINISKEGWPNGLTSNEKAVIIARSDVPADALASAGLSGAKDAPILLTSSASIDPKVISEIKRLNASKVYLLGGTTAIDKSVTDTLINEGLTVERIEGKNRFETAIKINDAAGLAESDTALLVNGLTIADALSASSISALQQIPIFLAGKDHLPSQLPSNVKNVTILGGTSAISSAVENQLKQNGIETTRIGGSNRFETNLLAINHFNLPKDKAIVVRGTSSHPSREDYPDAVASAGLAKKQNAAVVLTHPTSVRNEVKDFISNVTDTLFVLGGTQAVSQFVVMGITGQEVITNGVVLPNSLTVRSKPSSSSTSVGSLSKGATVEIHGFEGDWAKINYNNTWAYVHAFYLKIAGSNYLLLGHTIVVDPGHGGSYPDGDPGAVANGLQEKDVVLDIGLRLEKKLKEAGANVVMTRRTDVFIELEERAKIANEANANSFVSVHANAVNISSVHGSETFWNEKNSNSAESKELAEKIQERFAYIVKNKDRGVKEANFSVTRNSEMPAVLVEVGFLTNETEAERMKTSQFREESAEAIYQGILDFYR
ncbi:N-acetylmuramoyl-L-alanine amidase [Alkalihalobacillus sp. BA299]|uniref:N-acetylmuramoyl-L-alanine amidase n=1 Tax=Alkalihalobacillus sp. BA299 TaxID=2815938 RepID=UPI001ADBB441|nr:N-acetylmuramoyl-L-alanine amidase [Alkalihalobacillus sp. BA299]